MSTALFGVAELFYFTSALVLRDAAYLQSFSQDQRNTSGLLLAPMFVAVLCMTVWLGRNRMLRGHNPMLGGRNRMTRRSLTIGAPPSRRPVRWLPAGGCRG